MQDVWGRVRGRHLGFLTPSCSAEPKKVLWWLYFSSETENGQARNSRKEMGMSPHTG